MPRSNAFPPNYPVDIPRSTIANWLEFYADTMELNHVGAHGAARGWQRAGAKTPARRVRDGVSAIPIMPDIPGLGSFADTPMHSVQFENGRAWKGRKAIVFGTGNSGHDVAYDLCNGGAENSMLQRDTAMRSLHL